MAGNHEAVRHEVTAEILRGFKNNCVMPRLLNRNQEAYFKGTRKIGDSLDIRTELRVIGGSGQALQPEGLVRVTIPLAITNWEQEAFLWNDTEEAMFLDSDKQKYVRPHVVNLANKVDRKMLQFIQSTCPNWIGTPGVAPTAGVALDNIASAQTKMNQLLADPADRALVYNSYFNQPTVKENRTLFHPDQIVNNAYLKGKQGRFADFDVYLDEQVPSMNIGTYAGAGQVNGANQVGTNILTNNWTPGGLSLSQGAHGVDHCTFAGCFEINYQSREAYPGVLKQFAIVSPITDTAGAATFQIYPGIIPSGPYQNCSASPTTGGAVTILGTSGALCQTAVAIQEDAYTWVPIKLQDVGGAGAACSVITDPETGIVMRSIHQWDNRLGEMTLRIDFVWGIAPTEADRKSVLYFG